MKKKQTASQIFIAQDKKNMANKKRRSSRLFNVPELSNGGFNK